MPFNEHLHIVSFTHDGQAEAVLTTTLDCQEAHSRTPSDTSGAHQTVRNSASYHAESSRKRPTASGRSRPFSRGSFRPRVCAENSFIKLLAPRIFVTNIGSRATIGVRRFVGCGQKIPQFCLVAVVSKYTHRIRRQKSVDHMGFGRPWR